MEDIRNARQMYAGPERFLTGGMQDIRNARQMYAYAGLRDT